MPWRNEPKKGAVSCEKPRGTASRFRSVDTRMGEPGRSNSVILSPINKLRKVSRGTETSKYPEERKVNNDSQSSGERTGKSLNHVSVSLQALLRWGRGIIWIFTAEGINP